MAKKKSKKRQEKGQEEVIPIPAWQDYEEMNHE